MRIGVLGPFNPAAIKDFLTDSQVPSINESATAVNTLVRELLLMGHVVKVFTRSNTHRHKTLVLKGQNVEVNIIPSWPRLKLTFLRSPVLWPRRISSVLGEHIGTLDVLHAHWTYEYAKAASRFSRVIPVFVTVRDWCPYQFRISSGWERIYWAWKYWVFKQVMSVRRVTFIANSQYTRRMIIERYPRISAPIILNPIDKTWVLDSKKKSSSHQIISIADGLCSKRKNVEKLLVAFAEYRQMFPDARLHLVGKYERKSMRFMSWEQRGWLESVKFYGAVPHAQLTGILDEMSVLVHPSLQETFGNIFIEAMARCVPCIGGDRSGAVPEVLGFGKYGLLCDINDSHSICQAMMQLEDSSLRSGLVTNATAMLKSFCSSDVVAAQHVVLYQKAVAAWPRREHE